MNRVEYKRAGKKEWVKGGEIFYRLDKKKTVKMKKKQSTNKATMYKNKIKEDGGDSAG